MSMTVIIRTSHGRELTTEEAADMVIRNICIDDKAQTITLDVEEQDTGA